MSHLSTQEVTAGISRSALATLKKNGNRDTPHAQAAEPEKIVGDGCRETVVIDTPYRRLSVLETRDSYFILRDVSFVGSKADVSLIHLEPEQAYALTAVLTRLECFTSDDDRPKPTRRVRA